MDKMDKKIFKKIMEEMKAEFCQNVIIDLFNRPSHTNISYSFLGFSLLSHDYEFKKNYETRVATYIRDFLVNGVICQALKSIGYEIEKEELPDDDYLDLMFSYDKDYENKMGLEYIIDTGNKKIGIRYTDYSEQDISLIGCYEIDELWVIRSDVYFSLNFEDRVEKENCFISLNNYRLPQIPGISRKRIALGNFLKYFFGEKNAVSYIKFMRETIKEYLITYDMMYGSTLRFRFIAENELLSAINDIYHAFDSKKYGFSEKYGFDELENVGFKNILNENNGKNLQEKSLEIFKSTDILDYFIKKDFSKIMIGKSDFAKSFISSEVLFQSSAKNLADYTPIVCGYLKSIEQLMHRILIFSVDQGYVIDRGEKSPVDLTTHNYNNPRIKLSMENLIHFLHDPKMLRIENTDFLETLFDCLSTYKDECRNGYLHRNVINSWEQVVKIRNDTFLLYIMLLGGCRLGMDDKDTQLKLGQIEDDRLERIYAAIVQRQLYEVYIKPRNEKESIQAIRRPETSFPQFTKDGLLKNYELKFICRGKKHENREIVISRNQIPDEILYRLGPEEDDYVKIEY